MYARVQIFNTPPQLYLRLYAVVCLCLGLFMGCVTDKSSIKDNFRVLPLKDGYPFSPSGHETIPIVIFDDGALNPQQHKALIQKLAALQKTSVKASKSILQQKLNSCRLFVNVGRIHTHYRAVCDGSLVFEEIPLMHVSATVERETRTKGLPASRAKKKAIRNPWMDITHVETVTLMSAEKALSHLTTKTTTLPPSFYFSQKKIKAAISTKSISVLRAIIAKQAHRTNADDLPFLLQMASADFPELNTDAIRSLALRCTQKAQPLFEKYLEGDQPINLWSQRGAACLKAKSLGLMPRREKVPVGGPD